MSVKVLTTLGFLLVAAHPGSSAVVYQDSFNLRDGAAPVFPDTSLNWYGYHSGNTVAVSGGALVNNPGVNSARGVVGVFSSAIKLKVGESLRFDFKVTFLNGPPAGSNQWGLRFGFSHSSGSVGATSGDSAFNTDQGYFARVAFNGDSAPSSPYVDIVKETGSNADGILGGADTVELADGSGAPAAVNGSAPKRFGFKLTRIDDFAVLIELFQDGEEAPFYTLTDPATIYHAFDEVAVGTGAISSPLSLDDVVVTHFPAVDVTRSAGGGDDSKLIR